MIDIQGHRGARGLFPENTLEGFLSAWKMGVTAFELDVGLTADGVAVVVHDPVLNPSITRDHTGAWLAEADVPIHVLTYDQLERYDVGRLRPGSRLAGLFPAQRACDGARIPTLASVLSALPEARFTIEIKTDPSSPALTASATTMADAAIVVIEEFRAVRRVMVEAFDWRVQRHVRRVRPDIRLAWLTRPETVQQSMLWWDGIPSPTSVPAAVAQEGGPVWAPDYATLTENLVLEARSLGLIVLPWTVNEPVDMRRLMEWGVDGLISDRPDLALLEAGKEQSRIP